MNNNFAILTDSSIDLPADLVAKYNIDVIPLHVTIGDKTYANYPDEREITAVSLYAQLREGAVAQTSATNPETYKEVLEEYMKAGRDVLFLGLSSGLSCTTASCEMAAQELREEYPQRTIIVIDSLCACLGHGLLAIQAANERAKGKDIQEVAKFAKDIRLKIGHWFTVDDLFFLKRGGRVSATTALLGSALGIKPLLHMDDEGHLISVSKARGRKKVMQTMIERMKETIINPTDQIIYIGHGDCIEDATYLANLAKETFSPQDVVLNQIGPVIGAHSGPGTLAIFFLATSR